MMSHQPVVVDAYDTTQEAARRMRAHVVGVLPVLDGGHVVGIVTDRDLAIRVVATGDRPWEKYVREIMTPHPLTCRRDAPLDAALEDMIVRRVRRAIVLDEKSEVVGLLSVDDLVADDRTRQSALLLMRASAPARGELDGLLSQNP